MTRKNIFELMKAKYDFSEELSKISFLFNSDLIRRIEFNNYDERNCSIEYFINKHLFHYWKARGSCINCSDMKNALNIKDFIRININEDDIISHIEYFINLIFLFVKKGQIKSYYCQLSPNFDIMMENMNILLEHINYEKKYIEETEQLWIIPKNPEATSVAEISTEPTGLAILKYHHASLKGDLEEKRKILQSIALEYEPLLDNPPKEIECSLFTNTRGLLNNLNIRHNNTNDMGKNHKEMVSKMSNKELEEWYDDIYQMLLLCILEEDNIKRMKKTKDFFSLISKK